jgi:hypothetical protein
LQIEKLQSRDRLLENKRLDQTRLSKARVCFSHHLTDLGRRHLWQITGPLNLEPVVDGKKSGPPVAHGHHHPVPTGVHKEALFLLIESWVKSNDADDKLMAVSAVKKFGSTWARDPEWLSLCLHSYNANSKTKIVLPHICVTDKQHMEHMQEQFDMWPTPLTISYHNSINEATNYFYALKQPWSLFVGSQATFGPCFIRDYGALASILPLVGTQWNSVILGYHLPALETTWAMCSVKPKSLVAVKSGTSMGVGEPFALLVSRQAVENILAPDENRVRQNLALSSPTVFAPLY